jgi:catechol 2,3-dioxygenase-like lactoylglutathione lyase family enzyme
MIDHLELATSQLERSRNFYEATLNPLGYRLTDRNDGLVGFEGDNGKDFWLKAQPAGRLPHFAFRCNTRTLVERVFADAVKAGGSVSRAPKLLPHVHAHYFSGLVIDPDGYLIEFACHNPE